MRDLVPILFGDDTSLRCCDAMMNKCLVCDEATSGRHRDFEARRCFDKSWVPTRLFINKQS